MITITKAEANRIRKIIETSVSTSADVDDKTVSTVPTLLPEFKNDGSVLAFGARINWKGKVKKVAVAALYQRADQNPDNAPTLWADIPYKDGYRIIPEVITTAAAFAYGEIGWWKDVLYKSIRPDANVHTPEQAPDMWKLHVE